MIRRANDADRGVARRLLTEQLIEHDLPAEPERIDRGLDRALAPHGCAWLWLAGRGGDPEAILLGNEIVSVEHGGTALWIEELYVVPSARRKGIARALLTRIAGEARRRGIRAIELEVVPMQNAALALYRSLGFHEVHRKRWSLGL
ncbi:MAG TPA: GNAT family N-acetyltransferase [Myxococcales bacterium]|nr:GNAT family N-acetyltransferase [Myxococcales bacterium]